MYKVVKTCTGPIDKESINGAHFSLNFLDASKYEGLLLVVPGYQYTVIDKMVPGIYTSSKYFDTIENAIAFQGIEPSLVSSLSTDANVGLNSYIASNGFIVTQVILPVPDDEITIVNAAIAAKTPITF